MIVADLDVIRVAIGESKADPPLIVHGDGVLSLAVTLQSMEAIAGWHLQSPDSSMTVMTRITLIAALAG